MNNRIVINLKSVAVGFAVLVVTVTGLSGVFSILNYFMYHPAQSPATLETWDRVFNMFFLGSEINLPTWYATISLLGCAVVLALIAYMLSPAMPYARHWWLLAFIFTVLSIDENVSIHEFVGKISDRWLQMGGIFYYSWTLLGAAFVLILAVAYWPFLMNLPLKIRKLVIWAGVIYVFGALGLEMAEGYYFYLYSGAHFAYEAMIYVEEFCEMTGVALFLYALLVYVKMLLEDRTLVVSVE